VSITPRGSGRLQQYDRGGALALRVLCDRSEGVPHLTAGVIRGPGMPPTLLRGHGFGAPLEDLGGRPVVVRCRCGWARLDPRRIGDAVAAGRRVARHAEVAWQDTPPVV
jgi:hypothetical protein